MSDAEAVQKTAGEHLRAARETAGLSVEEVALKLKLSTRQVIAIEAQDWDGLPERTFTRGFFKSYARLVGVDEHLIDANFTRPASASELPPPSERIGDATLRMPAQRAGAARWVIPLALFACLCAGVAWMLWQNTPMPQASSKLPLDVAANAAKSAAEKNGATVPQLSPSLPTEIGAESQKSSLLLSNGIVPSASVSGATTPEAISANSNGIGTSAAVGTATSAAITPAVVANPNTTPSVTAPAIAPPTAGNVPAATSTITLSAGQKRVSLAVKGRSWTEVRSRGDIVLSEMLNNTSREIASSGPISFVIGNASNVTLLIDGQPYDFSTHVRNEVARFRVE
jgi:cytoskeleton protein RodZ